MGALPLLTRSPAAYSVSELRSSWIETLVSITMAFWPYLRVADGQALGPRARPTVGLFTSLRVGLDWTGRMGVPS